jgi:GT2 family glycosyltransferase
LAKTANWASLLRAPFNDASIGLVAPKLVFPDDTIQSAGGLFDFGKGPYHRYMGYRADDRRVNKPECVSWATGAAQLIPRALFNEVGEYDEDYIRGYFEDVDLCLRVRRAGYKIWYEPSVEFVHFVGQSATTKTDADTRAAEKTFRMNSFRFHRLWDEQIAPDVKEIWVNY